jgi:putative type II/III system pilus formation protein
MMNKTFKKRGLMSMLKTTLPLMVAAGIAMAAIGSAHAADALTVELDGARILKLDTPASDVVVANPNVADVTVQTPNRLVIIGMNDGTITMDTQVVVAMKNASAQVSVLAPDGGNVNETIFACSDRCTMVAGTKRTGPSGGGAGGSGGGDSPFPSEPTVDQLPPPTPGGGPSY